MISDARAASIAKFVEMSMIFTEQRRETSYLWLILCMASQIAELLRDRAERLAEGGEAG